MTRPDKIFVAVTAGRWQMPAINAARDLGLEVCAFDGDTMASGFSASNIFQAININDEAAVLSFLKKTKNEIIGCLSFASEVGMETMGAINDAYGLNGLSKTEASLFVDKLSQRKVWALNNLPNPDYLTVDSGQQVDDNFILKLQGLGSKLIVKPRQSSGSRGLTVLLAPYSIDCVQEAIDLSVSHSRVDGAIIETFINGTEFAAEGFTLNSKFYSLCLSEKRKVEHSQDTVASEYFTPDISPYIKNKIWQVVEEAVLALSLNDTTSHTEVLLDARNKVWLVESAGRGGGFMVAEGLLPWAFGVDLAKISVRVACKLDVAIPEPEDTYAILRFFPTQKGVLKSINGFNKCSGNTNLQVGSFVDIGAEFIGGYNDAARLGYILARGDSPKEVKETADFAMNSINFVIETKER